MIIHMLFHCNMFCCVVTKPTGNSENAKKKRYKKGKEMAPKKKINKNI